MRFGRLGLTSGLILRHMQGQDFIAGRVAVITGISQGIGLALSNALLERGATVIGWGRSKPEMAHERLYFILCDVSDAAQVEAAMEQTLAISPRVDFLVNNAGFGYFSPIETFDIAQFQRMMDVNVTGAFLVSRAVVPTLKAQRSGHIVSISSIAGKVGMPQGEGYNASKFALTGMTECLFQELRRDGIKVTTVFPGSTATHFFDSIPGMDANDKMLSAEELAGSIVHVLDTSPNFLIREIEVRPLNSK